MICCDKLREKGENFTHIHHNKVLLPCLLFAFHTWQAMRAKTKKTDLTSLNSKQGIKLKA